PNLDNVMDQLIQNLSKVTMVIKIDKSRNKALL
ncbi:hypothetical protein SZ25_00338, partial [Candidatus Arcanobacter lacustris]